MAAALPMIMAGVGMGASVAGTIGQGVEAKAAYGRQAQISEEQSQHELAAAGAQISNADMRAEQVISQGAASAGASGGTAETSAPVLSADYSAQKISDMYTKYSGAIASNADLYQAKVDKWQGQQALYASIFKGVTNVLSSGNQMMPNMMNLGVGSGSGASSAATSGTTASGGSYAADAMSAG
jgi:hypothetical protein